MFSYDYLMFAVADNLRDAIWIEENVPAIDVYTWLGVKHKFTARKVE